jgi:hypothetical protein
MHMKGLSIRRLEPTPRIRNEFTGRDKLARTKHLSNPKRMVEVAEQKLVPIVRGLVQLYDEHFNKSLSA